jgi:rhodanese-related sulfurtransferase
MVSVIHNIVRLNANLLRCETEYMIIKSMETSTETNSSYDALNILKVSAASGNRLTDTFTATRIMLATIMCIGFIRSGSDDKVIENFQVLNACMSPKTKGIECHPVFPFNSGLNSMNYRKFELQKYKETLNTKQKIVLTSAFLNIALNLQGICANIYQQKMENYFEGKAIVSNGIYNLSPLQAYKLCQQGAILIDVREEYLNRFKIFDVPGLIFCPKKILHELIEKLPPDKPLIIADASGIHSPEAVKMLMNNGFNGNCANLSGGLVDWEHAGLPVVIDYEERLSGQCACQLKPREKK